MRSLKIIIPAILQVAPKDNLDTTTLPSPKNNFPQSSASAKPKVSSTSNLTNQPSTGPEDEIAVQNIGILIGNIKPNQQISSPFTIKGIANVTSQTVVIAVHDHAGNVLGKARAAACVSLSGCSFEASIVFQKPQTQNGYIEAYSPSYIDNSPTFLQTIPVSF